MQLRQLAVRITERNNTRANIIRARVAIQSAYVQIMAHYEHGQLPDVLVAVTNAIIDSLVTLEHRWTLCNIEEQGDLECFRLFLWRQSGSAGTRERKLEGIRATPAMMPRPDCPWRQIAPKGDGSPDDLGNVPVTLDELEIDAYHV
jgi:hypothetical protein